MTASQIIEEMEQLPLKQRAEVLSALLRLKTNKVALSPDHLVALADQMLAATTPEKADRLEKKILAGFYGQQRAA